MSGGNFLHTVMSILLLVTGFFGGVIYNRYYTINNVIDYNSCVSAGNEILNTFPSQCKTANGRIFVEEVKAPSNLAPQDGDVVVSNFDQCVSAGNPVKENYPRSCSTPDGRTYIQELTADELPVTAEINQGVITTFEQCAASGFKVEMDLPRKCTTPDGKTFLEGLAPVPPTAQ